MKTRAGALLSSIRIDHQADRRISVQLYMGLRDIILSGGVSPGERLPATRTLSQDLQVSRTTVIAAIDRLTSEGLLESRVGSGTYVSKTLDGQYRPKAANGRRPETIATPRLSNAATRAIREAAPRSWLPHQPQAFITALPALDVFPMSHWARLSARHWRNHRDTVMGYGHPLGLATLREAITTHLNASRGIKCDPEQIFVVGGAQQAFAVTSALLLNPGDRVWFENPGAIGARNAFVACGAELVPVDIDEHGLSVADGQKKAPDFRLAFVTPSHQQPLGHVMPLSRRLELLRAAEEADALIIEDDYDGEFYYGDQPQPPLKSIDTQERVIYVGTFSKSLFPSLRLGFILSPRGLVDRFAQVCSAWLSGVPTAQQSIVSDFINEGLFATHVRQMRRIYKARHDALLEAASALRDQIEVVPTSSGFHTVGYLSPELDENRLVTSARERNIIVASLGRYSLAPVKEKGLVFGFGGVNPDGIRRGIEILKTLPEFKR